MKNENRELRKSVRRPTRRAAEVVISRTEKPIPCIVFDISNGGARLAVGRSTRDLPDRFTLMLYKDGSVQRDCEVVWFDSKYVGVKFVSGWYAAEGVTHAQNPPVTSQTGPHTEFLDNPDVSRQTEASS